MLKETITSEIGESYVKAEHSSGLKIYILEKPQYNSCYAIFGTKYGSIDNCFTVDGEKTQVPEGIAHFLEHKLFESEDGDAFTKYAETGAYANAFTSFDKTCYLFSCSDRFYDNLEILLNFVQSPYFTKETVQKEQGIIGQEIEMNADSPDTAVFENLMGCMYQNHPISVPILGTRASIAKITPEILHKCHRAFYAPNNMLLCVIGDVDPESVCAIAREHLPAEKTEKTTRVDTWEEETKVEKHLVEANMEVAMPIFQLGFKCSVEAR